MTVEYYALKGMTFCGEFLSPGDRVPQEKDPKRDYRKMTFLGIIEPRHEEGGGSDEGLTLEPEATDVGVTVSPPKDEPTRQELIDSLPEGIGLDDLQGTGANGYVTKGDIEEFLKSLED